MTGNTKKAIQHHQTTERLSTNELNRTFDMSKPVARHWEVGVADDQHITKAQLPKKSIRSLPATLTRGEIGKTGVCQSKTSFPRTIEEELLRRSSRMSTCSKSWTERPISIIFPKQHATSDIERKALLPNSHKESVKTKRAVQKETREEVVIKEGGEGKERKRTWKSKVDSKSLKSFTCGLRFLTSTEEKEKE